MKKILIFLICCSAFSYAAINQKQVSSEVATQKEEISDKLTKRFGEINWNDMVDTVDITEQVRDLDIDEDMVNSNIKITMTNKTDKLLTVDGMAYTANGGVCGYTKLNVKIEPGKTVSDFFMDKTEGLKCLKRVEGLNKDKYGHLVLIDVGKKFDIRNYQQYTYGLFLYPVKIKVSYTNRGSVAVRTQTIYLVYSAI